MRFCVIRHCGERGEAERGGKTVENGCKMRYDTYTGCAAKRRRRSFGKELEMIEIVLQLDNVDYDKIFDTYFEQAKELLGQSDEPAASLIARVPSGMARTIWNGLKYEQKEAIAAKLMQSQANKYAAEAVGRLREKGVDLHVKKADVRVK